MDTKHNFELPDRVLIEIEYDTGDFSRWALLPDDPRIEQLEKLLGTPDTIKV